MFAHATDCVQTYGCNVVVLQTTDTDIFVNAMYYWNEYRKRAVGSESQLHAGS